MQLERGSDHEHLEAQRYYYLLDVIDYPFKVCIHV